MTLYRHELNQGRKTFLIWTISIAAFMIICILMYPEMKAQMSTVSTLFASMGAFTAAFGMDKLDFGSLVGFYAIECGNIMGLGGAFYAAIISVNRLSKEEKEHTAEFLLSHPLSRGSILRSKLAAIFTELTLMNLIVTFLTLASIVLISEPIPVKELALLHLGYYLCHVEIALICYAISAFSRANNFGAGLALSLVLYFMSILANISDKAKICKILSPFGFAEGSDIITSGTIDWKLVALGMIIGLVFAAAGSFYYREKDIM